MMIRGDWRYLGDDPPASRRLSAVGLGAATLFATVWVVLCVTLLGALALRLL